MYNIIPPKLWFKKELKYCISDNSWYIEDKFYSKSIPGDTSYKAHCMETGKNYIHQKDVKSLK